MDQINEKYLIELFPSENDDLNILRYEWKCYCKENISVDSTYHIRLFALHLCNDMILKKFKVDQMKDYDLNIENNLNENELHLIKGILDNLHIEIFAELKKIKSIGNV